MIIFSWGIGLLLKDVGALTLLKEGDILITLVHIELNWNSRSHKNGLKPFERDQSLSFKPEQTAHALQLRSSTVDSFLRRIQKLMWVWLLTSIEQEFTILYTCYQEIQEPW